MFVRIARFEGGDPEQADQTIARVRQMMTEERPQGLEVAKRFLMMVDRQSGRGLSATFYDSEDDLRRGDQALNAITRPAGTTGERMSVEMYEVAIDEEL